MNKLGEYTKKPYSIYRRNIELVTTEGWKKRSFHVVMQIDVTKARKLIKQHKEKTGFRISFTGWIIKCVAQTMSEHKEFNSYKHGKKELIEFDDVDVATPIEKTFEGKTRPMVYILRKANEKDVFEITNEIRQVQKQKVDESTQLLGRKISRFERFSLNAPIFLKKLILWMVDDNALLRKKYMGTTGVTAIGMKGKFPGWVIPLGGTATTLFVVAGIIKKPGVINNKIQIREYLNITMTCDHDLIDGGPVARFTDRFINLMENAYALD